MSPLHKNVIPNTFMHDSIIFFIFKYLISFLIV